MPSLRRKSRRIKHNQKIRIRKGMELIRKSKKKHLGAKFDSVQKALKTGPYQKHGFSLSKKKKRVWKNVKPHGQHYWVRSVSVKKK